MSNFIPLSVPNFKGNELKYASEAIETEWVSTSGKLIEKFEKNLAEYIKAEDLCVLQSGTAALHLALILSEVQANDEVLVPTLTFIAGVNPIKYQHAYPVFMDCNDELCLDVEKVALFIENECSFDGEILINIKSQRQVKAIIATHIFGNVVDMLALMSLAQKYKLKVIEDASEALGSYHLSDNKFAGTYADFGIYSFNGNKIITTGGGGALTARRKEDVEKARYLSTQAKDDEIYYEHSEIGYNYRMTNIQAAIGLAQLEQLERFIEIKTKNFKLYEKLGLKLLPFNKNYRSNHWFYSLLVDSATKRDSLLQNLAKEKIQSRPLWKLIHTLKPYLDCEVYKIEKAYFYYEKVLNIPCSSNLNEEDLKHVVRTISSYL